MPGSPGVIREQDRFDFGRNWLSFIRLVNDDRIRSARESLQESLQVTTLAGRSFLDIGCGSGLFSLAAAQLGARVHSFDSDPGSVGAAAELRRRFAAGSDWAIEQGSILDPQFTGGLGHFDVVYSWGVLHHTGDLWRAMAVTARLVAPGGLLYLSVYNDQGLASRMWRRVKRRYNTSGELARAVLIAGSSAYLYRHRPLQAMYQLARPAAGRVTPRARGMSRKHDLIDWVGGYPFEVAKPEEVFSFARRQGFELRHLRTAGGGLGCNEFVFQAPQPQDDPGA